MARAKFKKLRVQSSKYFIRSQIKHKTPIFNRDFHQYVLYLFGK
jgi:hypothetical protein